MSRQGGGRWLRDTTAHGLLIVGVCCLCLLGAVATACTLVLLGREWPDRFDALLTGLLVLVPTLLARARRDAPLEDDEPVPVTLADEPVEAVVVGDDRPLEDTV